MAMPCNCWCLKHVTSQICNMFTICVAARSQKEKQMQVKNIHPSQKTFACMHTFLFPMIVTGWANASLWNLPSYERGVHVSARNFFSRVEERRNWMSAVNITKLMFLTLLCNRQATNKQPSEYQGAVNTAAAIKRIRRREERIQMKR